MVSGHPAKATQSGSASFLSYFLLYHIFLFLARKPPLIYFFFTNSCLPGPAAEQEIARNSGECLTFSPYMLYYYKEITKIEGSL